METIKTVIDWLVAHWSEIITAILAIIGALEVVVKWTETDKDDKAIASAKGIVEKVNKIAIEVISYITKLKGTK